MAYDSSIDVRSFSEDVTVGDSVLRVEVYQYNGNAKKVQIGRLKEDVHLKLGRLALDEVKAIVPLLDRAGTFISENLESQKEEEPVINADAEAPSVVEKIIEKIDDAIKEDAAPLATKSEQEEGNTQADVDEKFEKEEISHAVAGGELEKETTKTRTAEQMKKVLEEANKKEAAKDAKEKEENAYKPLPKFKIVIADADLLKEPLKVMGALFNEALIKVTDEKLSLVQMCPANVSMTIFELLSSACIEWDIEAPFNIGININNLNQIIKTATKHDVIEIYNKEEFKIGIKFKGKNTQSFELPVLDLSDYREQKVPDLKFGATLELPLKDLKSFVSEAGNVAESVRFTASKKGFNVFAEGDVSKYNVDVKAADLDFFGLDRESASKYSIEYLKSMTKISHKYAPICKLEFSKDYPIVITYQSCDKYKLRIIAAPRVDNEN